MNERLTHRFALLWLISLVMSYTIDSQNSIESISEIPLITMPSQNNRALLSTFRSSRTSINGPIDFAKAIQTSISPNDKGAWESLDNGQLRWRVRIASPTAHSLNIGFTSFYLPPSARLYMYDRLQRNIIGPITAHDNDDHREWWSPILPYDEVVLEVLLSPVDRDKLLLTLSKVNHDFTALGSVLSGACNVDVLCGAEDGFAFIDEYRDIINSVGMYTLNGVRQCSGVLVNNVRQDCTPYFLTANHCEINNNNARSVVVYWNYQNTFCRIPGSSASGNNGDGLLNHFTSGSRLLANYAQTDFALLQLDDDPSEFNPFFAGWDVQNESWDTTLSVHHPSSNEKRISIDYDEPTYLADDFFVRVEDWDLGTTEGGSSGAPLFSKNKHIIGQLNGGDAACGNNSFDDYGALKLSWDGGGTKETSLKAWLDPDNVGTRILDGRACSNILASLVTNNHTICTKFSPQYSSEIFIKSGFEKGASISIESAPAGFDVSLEQTSIIIGQRVKVNINVSPQFAASQAQVILIAVDSNNVTSDLVLNYSIFSDLPAVPVLNSPNISTPNIGLNALLDWTSAANEFIIEVSKDSSFRIKDFIFAQINSTSRNILGLQANTQYFWRVKAINPCGESAFSITESFRVGDIQCTKYTPTDLPKRIGTEAETVISTIAIDKDEFITDVNLLNIEGKHTWISDLSFRLVGPDQISVNLAINPCDDHDNFFITFDDQSPNVNLPCPLVSLLTFKPIEPLARFNGMNAKGNWTLEVIDDAALDGGSFDNWVLEICTIAQEQSVTAAIALPSQVIERCDGIIAPFEWVGSTNAGFLSDLTLRVIDNNGEAVAVQILPNPIPASTQFMIRSTESIALANAEAIWVIAAANEFVDTIVFSIEDIGVPVAPILSLPQNGMTGVQPQGVHLQWNLSPANQMYRVLLSKDSTLIAPLLDTTLTVDSLIIPFSLEMLTTYYWNVEAIATCGEISSIISSFTTDQNTATIELNSKEAYLFPNPAREQIILHSTVPVRDFVLYDLQGRIQWQITSPQHGESMPTDRIDSGVYLYDIRLADKWVRGKIVVLK